MSADTANRLFVGVYPAGLVYADRAVPKGGDYKRLAFLSYDTLALDIEGDCPRSLRPEIEQHAATIQARAGEDFQISTAGQTVALGRRQRPQLETPYDPLLSLTENLLRNGFWHRPVEGGAHKRVIVNLKSSRVYGPFDDLEATAWLKS